MNVTSTIRCGLVSLFVAGVVVHQADPLKAEGGVAGPASTLYEMPTNSVRTRWYTAENLHGLKGQGGQARFGRKGTPAVGIPAGKTLVLADIRGSGTIRRIWATLFQRTPRALRGLKIEIYWDGAKTPAVQAPLGDFFCESLGHMVAFENACFYSPEGRSFNCLIPMPFRRSAKVVLVNESGSDNGI